MRLALAALELEKAIYECGYELSNRPDWLWLPLSRLVRAG
jgi:predicted trehalose synthase